MDQYTSKKFASQLICVLFMNIFVKTVMIAFYVINVIEL